MRHYHDPQADTIDALLKAIKRAFSFRSAGTGQAGCGLETVKRAILFA
jgi:hypothetical protein